MDSILQPPSVSDFNAALQIANQLGGVHPVALAGRMLGMSPEERQAGVPAWAWVAVAFVGGAAVAWWAGPKLERWIRR